MNQPQPVQVSNTRVHEVFKGKTAAVISDLMQENAQLTAAAEAMQQRIASLEDQLVRLTPAPEPASPPAQD